eukprot:9478803-Ditylum_brightwellii.AAC.1
MIISYDQFRLNSTVLSSCTKVGLLVVDEGHRLKNVSGSQTLRALESFGVGGSQCDDGGVPPPRLLITGTPVQNNL